MTCLWFFSAFQMEDDRLMEFRNLMKMLEEQVGNVLDLIKTFDGKDKEKQRAIDVKTILSLMILLVQS